MNKMAGYINGKEKAIGIILLLPVYLYIGPKLLSFAIYLLLKYDIINMDMTTLNVMINMIHSLIMLILCFACFHTFLKDNIKAFIAHWFEDVCYAMTIGTMMLYVLTFIVNIAVHFVMGEIDSSSANQMLFESYFHKHALLMIVQSVIFAPIVEEILFRGLIYRGLEGHGRLLAMLVSSLAFGFIHIHSALFSGDLMQLVHLPSYAVMGLGFAIAYNKKGTICVPVLMHMIHNLIAVILLVVI